MSAYDELLDRDPPIPDGERVVLPPRPEEGIPIERGRILGYDEDSDTYIVEVDHSIGEHDADRLREVGAGVFYIRRESEYDAHAATVRGRRVRLLERVDVRYGDTYPDDVYPAGSIGTVEYELDDDIECVGVRFDGIRTAVEVRRDLLEPTVRD